MSHPTTRVLALLELLQAHHRIGGRELADRLGVDERTVRRYATRLAELGIPVRAERGRYGGYRLLPGYKLPPLMLTDAEATAVVLGLVAGRRVGLTTTDAAAEQALAKIHRVLPARLRERVQSLREALEFTLPPRDAAAPASSALLDLAEATRRRQRVRIGYRSWRAQASERELDPYGLVFHSGRWYVTGHDHRRDAVRTFRIDRITAVAVLPTSFDEPAGFDPVGQVSESLARVPYRHRVEVLLETDLATARTRIPPTVAGLAETPDGVLLTGRAERLDGMAHLLAGLEWPFTVLDPPQLRDELRALAERLRGYAERG